MLKNRNLKNASWIVGCKIIQSALGFVMSIIIARYLGPSDFGVINYASSITTFILPIVQLGFTCTIVREFIDDPDNEGEILGSSLAACGVTSFLGFVVMCAVSFVANVGERETVIVCVIFGFSMITQAFEITQYWFQSKLMSKYYSLIALGAYIVVAALKLAMYFTHRSVYWFAATYSIDYFLISAALLVCYAKLGGPKLSFSFERVKDMFSRSKYYIWSGLMVAIFAYTDKIMLKHMISDEATGIYTTAIFCSTLADFVFVAIIDSARPTILESRKNGDGSYNGRVTSLYSLIIYLSLAECVVICLLSDLLISITYGEAYALSADVIKIAVWYTTFAHLGGVRNIWILAEGKQKYLLPINITGAVTNVVLNAVLIPGLGIMGAAVASLISQFVTNVATGFIIKPIRENNKLMLRGFNPKYLVGFAARILKNR